MNTVTVRITDQHSNDVYIHTFDHSTSILTVFTWYKKHLRIPDALIDWSPRIDGFCVQRYPFLHIGTSNEVSLSIVYNPPAIRTVSCCFSDMNPPEYVILDIVNKWTIRELLTTVMQYIKDENKQFTLENIRIQSHTWPEPYSLHKTVEFYDVFKIIVRSEDLSNVDGFVDPPLDRTTMQEVTVASKDWEPETELHEFSFEVGKQIRPLLLPLKQTLSFGAYYIPDIWNNSDAVVYAIHAPDKPQGFYFFHEARKQKLPPPGTKIRMRVVDPMMYRRLILKHHGLEFYVDGHKDWIQLDLYWSVSDFRPIFTNVFQWDGPVRNIAVCKSDIGTVMQHIQVPIDIPVVYVLNPWFRPRQKEPQFNYIAVYDENHNIVWEGVYSARVFHTVTKTDRYVVLSKRADKKIIYLNDVPVGDIEPKNEWVQVDNGDYYTVLPHIHPSDVPKSTEVIPTVTNSVIQSLSVDTNQKGRQRRSLVFIPVHAPRYHESTHWIVYGVVFGIVGLVIVYAVRARKRPS